MTLRAAPGVIALALALVLASGGRASWTPSGEGTSAAKAQVMPSGNVPSASASGSTVTVTWAASVFASGDALPGYVVRRYNSVTGAQATTLAACAGVVSALACTESGVPPGAWRYSVTAAAGKWRGAESARSASVTVLV